MIQNVSERVCAVVVSHNRLAMVQNCVSSIRSQTNPPAEVIIVDNDSTDGTRDWLSTQKDLHVVLQSNLGGAGGFYAGMKCSLQLGYDWVWCMDDDGYALPDCLERLLAIEAEDLRFRSPVVLALNDCAQLAFAACRPDGTMLRTAGQFAAAAEDGLVLGVGFPFNGVLIHRRIIESIGFPLAGMFLWGDEMEFSLRATRAGYQIATVVLAHFQHPRDRMVEQTFRFLGRNLYVNHVGNALRDYLAVRNRAYILRHYFGLAPALKFIARHALFYLRLRGTYGMLWAVQAGWSGLRGDWTGHWRYLE
jgi:rhamnopyranosyl-N-acetylglucosaminyl-diphospho-decaprenol beta-1,3/1,4-galactofuranosyltransferase